MMHGHEKSDLVIVAMKPANKARKGGSRKRRHHRSPIRASILPDGGGRAMKRASLPLQMRCLDLALVGYAVMRRFGGSSDLAQTLSSLTRC
jgi:hypothetical protein